MSDNPFLAGVRRKRITPPTGLAMAGGSNRAAGDNLAHYIHVIEQFDGVPGQPVAGVDGRRFAACSHCARGAPQLASRYVLKYLESLA